MTLEGTTVTDQPARYRNKTAEIEAVQWTGDNADQLRALCGPDFDTIDPEDRAEDPDETAAVRTHPHGGWLGLKPGDWVLKHADHFTATSDEAFHAVWEPTAPPADRAALRDRIAKAIRDNVFVAVGSLDAVTDAVLGVLPEHAERGAVPLPRRGDAFEAWLKAQRDEYETRSSREWRALDEVLDTYRLHADTGTPLGEHVCEGQAVGDCECLETKKPPMDPVHILGIEADTGESPIVAFRSRGGRLLRCLKHTPGAVAVANGEFDAVTAEDLPEGGVCTYPECGVDVLIPQPTTPAP